MDCSNRETKPSIKTSRRAFTGGTIAAGVAAAAGVSMTVPAKAQSLSPTEAQKIAEDLHLRLFAHYDRGHARSDEQCAEG
jgi:hypothetical protein